MGKRGYTGYKLQMGPFLQQEGIQKKGLKRGKNTEKGAKNTEKGSFYPVFSLEKARENGPWPICNGNFGELSRLNMNFFLNTRVGKKLGHQRPKNRGYTGYKVTLDVRQL